MRDYDSTSKMRNQIQKLNQKIKTGKSAHTHSTGSIRTYYRTSTFWNVIEEVLLKQMMKQEHEYSRAALVRRCIHERAMRTLGEEYYEIIEEPAKFIK